jgi:hypothetical protein
MVVVSDDSRVGYNTLIEVLWDVTLYHWVSSSQHSEESWYFQNSGSYSPSTQCHKLEELNLQHHCRENPKLLGFSTQLSLHNENTELKN